MSQSIIVPPDLATLRYIVTHVFCPLQLHDGNDDSVLNDRSLVRAIASVARRHSDHVGKADMHQWHCISRMLDNLSASVQFEILDESQTVSQLTSMNVGDVLAFLVRAQNAAVLFRKQETCTIFESFEVSPKAQDVMTTRGKLICSYPGPAIEIPNTVFEDESFLSELANFLVRMNVDVLDAAPTSRKAQSTVTEERDTTHPRYITELLTGILRSVGRPADIVRITKRVGDDVVWNHSELPWRRSSLWLLIRVAIQTSLDQSTQGHDMYKQFMLFFMCRLANDKIVLDLPNDLLQSMLAKISRRFRKISSSAPDWLSRTALQTYIELSLLTSSDYLRNALAHRSTNTLGTRFKPEHCSRGSLEDFLSSDGAFFEEAYGAEPHVALYDVEWAVEQGIDAWVDGVTDNDTACEELEILGNKYSSSAMKTYGNNPELLSVMLLTTIELWVALDKIAIKEIPILADYSPEIPISILEHLLLSRTGNFRLFSPSTTADSFAVRFSRNSLHLQDLKSRIEGAARHDVHEKIAELERANARHAKLTRNAARLDHDVAVDRYGFEYHLGDCKKCSIEKECRKMEITVHEWPLPVDQLDAEVAIFELDCPVSFDMWRTATFHLLVDLCSPSVGTKNPYILLTGYAALKPYLIQHPRSRITLGSDTKPFVATHYSKTHIPTTQDRVCVNNVSGPFDIRRYCTYDLHSGPYQNLQRYVDTTAHTGDLLQWLNILRELRGRSLTFRRHEAASQVGPLKNSEWKWHRELQEPTFCDALLGELESLIQDVEANWLEVVTMDTISFLLRRLLASSPNQTVSSKAFRLLRIMRSKVFSWVQELSAKLTQTPGNDEFRGFLRDAAAICRSTFDVDPSIIRHLLHSPEDVDILLSSAILIHDHTLSNFSSLPAYSRLLLDRDRRLSLAIETVVSDVLQADASDDGIDLAVGSLWPDYRPGSSWTPLESPNSRWFSCKTASATDQRSQVVHFNLLDGSLLVNGKPLGRLPSKFLRHPLYNLVFGKQVLDVIPSDLAGMDYSTRSEISGHQIYFSLRNDSNLVIKAKRKSAPDRGDIIELIPQDMLSGDLPAVLIEGHVHWLDLSTSIMEVRPLDKLWETSSENWKMYCTPGRYRMQKGNQYLVDIHSQSWAMVSPLLQPLDIPQNLLVSVSPIDSSRPMSPLQLSVSLPRYDLSFYVDKDGDLQSHNMRGMVYDKNQSIETLFGLVNRLVLRPKTGDFDISFQKDGHHVRVEVTTPGSALERVTYQTYKVDTDLGCLTGNVSLTNKLYCAYLHALTSGYSTDPLTERTGTEEALSLLRSVSCSSIMRLSSREAELLSLIASICPTRTWYPRHLKRMQKVAWHNLPVSTQHHELYIASEAIKSHYERVQLFLENQSSPLFPKFPEHDDHLLRRSALRAAYLFPSEFPGRPSGVNHDVRYSARDLVDSDSGEQRAYVAATSVCHRTAHAPTRKNILSMVGSWGGSAVFGTASLSLEYDSSWLAPNLPLIWLQAYKLMRRIDDGKWFQMLFSLPAMAYASSNLSDLVPVFVAFARDPHFRREDPPPHDFYNLAEGYSPSGSTLRSYISNCALSFKDSPESFEPIRTNEIPRSLRKRRLKLYNDRCDSDINATVRGLMHAWSCETPPRCSLDADLYRVSVLISKVQTHFSNCYRNVELKEHLTRVQNILNYVYAQASPISTPRYSFLPSQSIPSLTSCSINLGYLFTRPALSLQEPAGLPPCTVADAHASLSDPVPLDRLLTTIEANAKDIFQRRYVSALRTSAECFRRDNALVAYGETKLPSAETLVEYYMSCRDSYIEALECVEQHLGPRNRSQRALVQSGQWPRITADALFRSLASNSAIQLSEDWKACLVQLLRLHLDNLFEELRRELQNEGCDGWDAETHPDRLLIQLQGNFLVRRVQAEVATEMISPRSGSNTAMQLNMGEGKSSVIVPIVVAVLADGSQLTRVIVPKALTAQMFNLLVDRLGGLVNRRIYFLPFSRSLEVDHHKAAVLRNIISECMTKGGILVVQPEHVLSLKLVSVEKQLLQGEEREVAELLLELQMWLDSRSRDILDESDEILHVRYQLVYTIGLQQHMEGFPERWTTTEQVLGLVSKHASSLQKRFPLGVEYESGPSGSFPHLRILHADAVQDVIDGRLPNFNFGQLRSAYRNAIRSFISCENVPPAKVQLVKEYAQQTPVWGGLLLLRGLLATGILLYAFRERRWRVDYGLAPTRTMLAVPYRAKDVPAQRAEFGHPDIAIILTCLSSYYGGLSEEQLRLSFEILLKQDDPSLDYNSWVEDCRTVPECLRTLNGVNINRNQATVDFYLSNVVFPKEAKEFPSKLSCSGWDLAEEKERLLTGFSGTNDGRYLLPLDITQHDPDHQRGTNAKVLSYLLQPENKYYMCVTHKNGERRTTSEFLSILAAQKPEIRVLLDVGAQMLDLRSCELAKAWLAISTNVSAAIYFNEDDDLTVLTRDGNTHLFISSPFAQQLDQCIVYLDDAHTRGTDIKFPSGFRAAVTLGPKVTKDRLAQGCMRMRKLGHGHSLMFFAPLEIDRRIRSVARKSFQDVIDTMDILQWAVRETCDDIQQQVPHWAQQGMDHTSRYAAWTSYCEEELPEEDLADAWLQPDAKKLEELYGPRATSNSTLVDHPHIRQRCIDLGVLSLCDVSMDEEQEREVVHEAERERQVERPPRIPPAAHLLHADVVAFVKTGIVPTASKGFRRVIETLDVTSAAANEPHVWSPYILATADSEKTVKPSGMVDEYLRPVMWVASGGRAYSEAFVVLSPYEVNKLLPYIKSHDKVHLHMYTPRITKSMKSCDDLALYNIPTVPAGWTPPSRLMDQLNVFAGQLYLEDYETYIRLCRFFCVYARDLEGKDVEVGCDGFITPNNRPRHLGSADTFQTSPLESVRTLIGLRRKGMHFAQTDMGKLLDGRLLSEDDFEDACVSEDSDEPEDASEDEPEDVSEDELEEVSEDSDEPEDASEDEPEDVSEEKPKDVSEDEPEDMSEEKPKGVSGGKPEDVSEDKPKDVSRDKPEDVSEDKPENVSEEKPKDMSEDSDEPEDASEDEPEDVSEEKPKDVSEDEPEDMSEEKPKGVSGGKPEDVSEEKPKDVSEDEPEDMSEDSDEPEDASEDEPEDVSEEKPKDVSGKKTNPKTRLKRNPKMCLETSPKMCLKTNPKTCLKRNPKMCLETSPKTCLKRNPKMCLGTNRLKTNPKMCLKTNPKTCLKTNPKACLKRNPKMCLETNPKTCLKRNPKMCLETNPKTCLKTNSKMCQCPEIDRLKSNPKMCLKTYSMMHLKLISRTHFVDCARYIDSCTSFVVGPPCTC
ncbi:hypothetical protein V8E55_009836 [Tylopilus felleus]